MEEPILIPPTWNKTEYHRTLSIVWQKAAQVLSEAHNIFVIGYSMPESDTFFRQLYALGTVGSFPLQRFWVFNPDSSGLVMGRFQALMGSGALDRFQPYPLTFMDAIPIMVREFVDREFAQSILHQIEEA
jgi:hypothetical protein